MYTKEPLPQMPSLADQLINATQSIMCLNEGSFLDSLSPKVKRIHSRASVLDKSGKKAYVVNRHGEHIAPRWDEITDRIEELCSEPEYGRTLADIDAPLITQQVIQRFKNGMTTREIDMVIAQICSAHGDDSGDWLALAARICVSDLHKRSAPSMKTMMSDLIRAAPERVGGRLSAEYLGVVNRFSDQIDKKLDFSRDYRFSIFGFQTIARSYLLKSGDAINESTLADNQLVERPQHWYMRVALLHCFQSDKKGHEVDEKTALARLEAAFIYYDLLSLGYVSNATPTLLNTGTNHQQESSCFQLGIDDSIKGFGDNCKYAMDISKWSGGESHWLHMVRAQGSLIRSTGGRSQGLGQLMRTFNEVQRLANQGGNRPGAFAMYLEPWHADVFTFLKMGRINGITDNAPDLKYALYVNDAFMRAVKADGDWYLMCPDECPGLHRVYGEEFDKLYFGYVSAGKYRRKIKAREIIEELRITVRQVGNPYVVAKDHLNAKSNMNHLPGAICSSNLCTETALRSFPDEEAKHFGGKDGEGEHGVCNLAALCLETYLVENGDSGTYTFDFGKLIEAAGRVAVALDKIIDITYYPTEQARRANMRHRPIGIGIIGLADVFAKMKLAFGSVEACALDQAIAAAIYFGALQASTARAETEGAYETFPGSPVSKGILQPDMWAARGELSADWEEQLEKYLAPHITREKIAELRERAKRGVRNGYLCAYMPTATTSNIVGQNECFEPFTANIYPRKTLAGEFIVVNSHLVRELRKLGVWNDAMRKAILRANGSVQQIAGIPDDIKERYRTARELDQRLISLHAAARGAFICQTQSLNYYTFDITMKALATLLIYNWELGLKTLWYYVHSSPATGSLMTTLNAATKNNEVACEDEDDDESTTEGLPVFEQVCPRRKPGEAVCTACSV